jgi:predicted dehydrogenase
VVWDLAPHDVAMLNHLFGADPVAVSAIGHCYVQKELGIEDVAFVTLEYPGKRLVHIHVSWLDPNKVRLCTFVGSRKMLVYDDVSPSEKIRVYDKGVDVQPHYENFGEFQLLYRSGDVFIPRLDTVEPLKAETTHFLDVIKGTATPLSSGEHGLRVVQVLEGACRSMAENGRQVDLKYDA